MTYKGTTRPGLYLMMFIVTMNSCQTNSIVTDINERQEWVEGLIEKFDRDGPAQPDQEQK